MKQTHRNQLPLRSGHGREFTPKFACPVVVLNAAVWVILPDVEDELVVAHCDFLFNGNGVVHNVFTCKSPSLQSRIHPTQKPLGLMGFFVELFSQARDTVIDPFGGSKTTLIAAAQKNRKAIGYEALEDYYKSAFQHIKDALEWMLTTELFTDGSEDQITDK